MATVSILNLLPGSSSPLLASGDVVPFVDVSDTTQSPAGSTVRATLTQFFAALPVPVIVTSTSANALAVGRQGSTAPVLLVDASTASVATGLKVKGAAAAGGVAVSAISSGTDENLTIDAAGSGTITLAGTSTGRVLSGAAVTITTTSSTGFVVGRQGATNPAFQVDASAASQACGLKVLGGSAGGNVAVSVVSSATDENLTVNAKGTGTIDIGNVSTGTVNVTPTLNVVSTSGIFAKQYTMNGSGSFASAAAGQTITVSASGNLILNSSASVTIATNAGATTVGGIFTASGLITASAGATIASGQTLTLTGATVTGLTAASVGAGTYPAGAHVFNGAVSGITTLGASGVVTLTDTTASTSTTTGSVKLSGGLGVAKEVYANRFNTASGSTSCPNTVATTLYTISNSGLVAMYLVTAGLQAGDANNYTSFAIIKSDDSTASIVVNYGGAAGQTPISLSGLNIQMTQSTGSTQNIKWFVTRVA